MCAAGATQVATPGDVVKAADVTFAMLSDPEVEVVISDFIVSYIFIFFFFITLEPRVE